jgi:hypothetical protein
MMRQNYYGREAAENLLDRQALFTDRSRTFTDGTKRCFAALLDEKGV